MCHFAPSTLSAVFQVYIDSSKYVKLALPIDLLFGAKNENKKSEAVKLRHFIIQILLDAHYSKQYTPVQTLLLFHCRRTIVIPPSKAKADNAFYERF